MANAEELERLVALKEKGALSQEEFERAKHELLSPQKKAGILGKTIKALLGIGLLLIAGSIWYYKIETNGTGVPACDSNNSLSTLKKAFDSSQFARSINISVIEITEAREKQWVDASKTRFCTAQITMNNAKKVPIVFTMAKRDSGGFMLEFEIAEES